MYSNQHPPDNATRYTRMLIPRTRCVQLGIVDGIYCYFSSETMLLGDAFEKYFSWVCWVDGARSGTVPNRRSMRDYVFNGYPQ